MNETIQTFRRFNRFHTRLLGLLNRRLLSSPLSLAEARTLFEIVHTPGVSAGALARELGMDRGQLSRIVARLLKQNLIEREGLPAGRKRLPLHPTSPGRELLAKIEASADRQAASLITPLGPRQRTRLRSALEEAEGLLGKLNPQPGENEAAPRLREAEAGDLGWIVTRHAEIYAREHGFTREFEAYVLLGLAEYAQKDETGSRVWVAERGGERLGSVGIVELDDGRAQLRWLLVEPQARGLGLGKRLVARAVSFCRERRYRQVILWTIQDLHVARSLYASFGFKLAESKQGIMGGRSMMDERWVLDLA